MRWIHEPWDYLIVTASNERQADAYRSQLDIRRRLGMLAGIGDVLVVSDPGGRRIGSGGSTVLCLAGVLDRELSEGRGGDPAAWLECLRKLRILIVHGGGDSRRLPAYSPCGKVFIPLPCESDSSLVTTLFDRQLPAQLELPPPAEGNGQVVITAGDSLLQFDPAELRFDAPGVIGVGCPAPPEQAANHGVYCARNDGDVRLVLQKPSPEEQKANGAVDRYGRSILDTDIISFDAETAVSLLTFSGIAPDDDGHLAWSGPMGDVIDTCGMDFYREICCALGSEATPEHHAAAAKASGSRWDDTALHSLFDALAGTPVSVQLLPHCEFLHFGTTRQIITSGIKLRRQGLGVEQAATCLSITNEVSGEGRLTGRDAWVEGCAVHSPLTCAGENVVVGVDIEQELSLGYGACLEIVHGQDRAGQEAWFARCYGADDKFKDSIEEGATLCNIPIIEWLDAAGAEPSDVWDESLRPEDRQLWNARVFPAIPAPDAYRRWLWMHEPSAASEDELRAWREADRYSAAELAELADHASFHKRREQLQHGIVRRSLRRMFRRDSCFSAQELAHVLRGARDRAGLVAEVLAEARWHCVDRSQPAGRKGEGVTLDYFLFSRVLHSLGTAVGLLTEDDATPLAEVIPGLDEALGHAERAWCETLQIAPAPDMTGDEWSARLRNAVFRHMGRTIITNLPAMAEHPVSNLRSDEIVWGRAPARIELGGGWTDTPPYTFEYGGCMINAAVNLNGQPPIQAYARVIDEPVIRVGSIDLGRRIRIDGLDELMDYQKPGDAFALVKAALALSGLSPEACPWPKDASLRSMLESFGGGIELTTLAAIPKGSGLGTSSIVGAVILAVIKRVMGQSWTSQELFHDVLRLEQAITTGGGWQDQIGGAVPGVKLVTTEPGLFPNPRVHYLPPDIIDPRVNGGQTLLYYTGITRVAKNILETLVGSYMDRNRVTTSTLKKVHLSASVMADTFARKDIRGFGKMIDVAWTLNKRMNPGASNEMVEALLSRIERHVWGARISGAGSGGFLIMICKSPEDAAQIREMLEAEPPNDRARFFDFDVSHEGLEVSVC